MKKLLIIALLLCASLTPILAQVSNSDLFLHKRINLYDVKHMPNAKGKVHKDSIVNNRIWRCEQPRLYAYQPGAEELDEPTAFLDYPSKVETMKLLHHLAHKMDKTILLSTHDLETSLTVTDNIWLLDRKKKLKTGDAGDFEIKSHITSEKILKLFTNYNITLTN